VVPQPRSFNGLIPSAIDPQQERLEAAVPCTLTRPSVVPAPEPRPGTCFGLEGVTPDVDTLELRPARKDSVQLLARILPARTPHAIVGVPELRPRTRSRTGLTLTGVGMHALISVHALDGVRTIVALADVAQPVSRHRLDDVREALRERGIADFVVIPRLAALRGWAGQPEVPAQPGERWQARPTVSPTAITAALGQRRPGTH
jgi:hypothetical protein